MKKLIIFGEPLSSPSKLAEKHGENYMTVNHVFKAIVKDDKDTHFGLAFHYGGLGGYMTFVTDKDVSFVGEEVNIPTTRWWLNNLRNDWQFNYRKI